MKPLHGRTAEFHDCKETQPGQGAELFVVEGDSAAQSVCGLRDPQLQAVVAMQGKPLNAYKAKRESVLGFGLYHTLLQAIECPNFELPSKLRFERIILLFDPDADGIHCGALMTLFFYRWLKPIIDCGHLYVARPPLFEIATQDRQRVLIAHTEEQYRARCAELKNLDSYKRQRYRGLGSMPADVLASTCIYPKTRRLHQLTVEDAVASAVAFGGKTRTNRPAID